MRPRDVHDAVPRAVAIEPGGQRAAVATERGVEVVDLVDRARVGEPIPVDANIMGLFWTGEGRLNGVGPNGVHHFDVDRSLLLGEIDAEFPTGDGSSAVPVAPDATGVVIVDPTAPASTYVDAATGAEVDLGATDLALPLSGGRWFALDVAAGIATTGDAAGVDASADVPGLRGARWNLSRIEVAGDRAVVLLRDRDADEASPDRSVVLALDVDTGELLDRIEVIDGPCPRSRAGGRGGRRGDGSLRQRRPER